MKNIFLIMIMATITFFSYGQKTEVNSAYNHYQNGYLDRAKMAIDKAILNDFTKSEAKTWLYRGNIYIRLAAARDSSSSDFEYRNLCTNCAEIAYDAYRKALELDHSISANMNISTPQQGLGFCSHYLYEDAFALFKKEQHEEAFLMAEKAYKADNTKPYVTFFYGLMAQNTNRSKIAKDCFNSLVAKDVRDVNNTKKDPAKMKELIKTKDVAPYLHLVNIYKSENDTANVLRVLQAGNPIFFSDDSIFSDYAVAYSIGLSWAGQSEKAAEVMNKALTKYPNNYILLVNYGSELNNEQKYKEAEVYLKRAVELEPNNVFTVFNLASCYYNSYVQRVKEIEDIVNNDEYRAEQEKANELLKNAQPYLEKAHQLDPKDRSTLIMLKAVYANMGKEKEEELKAVEEKLNAL